ncbi:lactonase family protein [Pseudoalteromonas sp. SA25]|uniref:lactonase family protein n=1 Tax=Pseudoalteromonas sp. SA25 TaxID=2686347 RepID=UPI0013FDDA72|nr:lactonase family protein [Pseudoalteromonas sp. SA25]
MSLWLTGLHIRLEKCAQLFVLISFIFCLGGCQSISDEQSRLNYFLVGSYTNEPDQGVYLVSYNESDDLLINERVVVSATDPSYLNWQPTINKLYSIGRGLDKKSVINVYDWKSNAFTKLKTYPIEGKGLCHINISDDRQQLAVVNYTTGNSELFNINKAGLLVSRGQFTNTGSSITPRQRSAHLHFSGWDKQSGYLYLTDLGTDEIIVFDSLKSDFTPVHRIELTPGDGPRHLAFHPAKKLVFSLNELSNSISIFKILQNGALLHVSKTNIMPAKVDEQQNLASAIRISEDGRHVYVAVRGENAIYGYQLMAETRLQLINKVSSGGLHPRDFNFSKSQKQLLVANQYSNNVVIIKRDLASGKLFTTQSQLQIDAPSYVSYFN